MRQRIAKSFTHTLLGGLLLAGLGLALRPAAGSAQPKTEPDEPLTRLYFGNAHCAQCHNFAETPTDKGATDFSARTEMHVWYTKDKHKDALKVLQPDKPLAKQMARLLKIDGRLTEAKECVTCHGMVVPPADADRVHFSYQKPADRIASGVSCQVCHGAYADWIDAHVAIGFADKKNKKFWRDLTREEKQTRFGLNDLWDPARRAAMCISCHVGNAAEGKVVTHEMYAAGHPPLPGFELAAFTRAMPNHWEPWADKLKRLPKNEKLYAHAYHFDADRARTEQTRMLAVGSVVALRASVKLMDDLAKRQTVLDKKPGDGGKSSAWPELAAFDCYACHHDLKSDGWRQKRGYTGAPGRPAMRVWPLALADVTLDGLKPAPASVELAGKLRPLHAVLNRNPFGTAAEVAATASPLVTQLDELIRRVNDRPLTPADTRRLLTILVNRPKDELLDFDSARQLGWGLQTLLAEADPAVRVPLTDLETRLKLTLPVGQQQIADGFLRDAFGAIRDYDPERFQKMMAGIAGRLATEK
jgi:hypothetical protein